MKVDTNKAIVNNSAELAQISHQLQVLTGKPSIKLINVFKFDQSQPITDSMSMLMKNQKNKTWIDATINITDFSKQYCRLVLQKQIMLQDLILYVGHINIQKYSNQPNKIFTFLLCKAWLGTAGTSLTPKVENCNSIIIPPQSDQAFQYNFFLKHHSQYQIKYEVSFIVSDEKQFKLSQFLCTNCENKIPVIYCSTQNLYFCQQCCRNRHLPRMMYTHELSEIDKVNSTENCKVHGKKYKLYCQKCQKYLCELCPLKGVHPQDHIVKQIRHLYQELDESIESLPKKHNQKITALLQNLKIRRTQIKQHEQELTQQIQQQYKKCLQLLQQQISKKYQLLDSCQLELVMLKDRISWNQSFCLFQSRVLKPIHFFKEKSMFEAEIKNIKVLDFDTVSSCKPDLVFQGTCTITTTEGQHLNMTKNGQIMSRIMSKTQNHYVPTQTDGIAHEKIPTLLQFNRNAAKPKEGQLFNEIVNCHFKFFKTKNK